MAEISDSLLKKIKESENIALERVRKIQQYERDIKFLESRCQEELEDESRLKLKLENLKQEVLDKKIDKSQMMLQFKSSVKMYNKKKDLLRSGKKQRVKVLQEITDFMDNAAETCYRIHAKYGFSAQQDERLEKIQQKVSLFEVEVKKHFDVLNQKDVNSHELVEVAKRIEFEKKSLNLTKELSLSLEAESNELMIHLDQNDSTAKIKQLEEDIRHLLKKVSEIKQDAAVNVEQDNAIVIDGCEDSDKNIKVNVVPKLEVPKSPKPPEIKFISSNHQKSPRANVNFPQLQRPGTPRKRPSVEVVSNGARFVFKKPFPPKK